MTMTLYEDHILTDFFGLSGLFFVWFILKTSNSVYRKVWMSSCVTNNKQTEYEDKVRILSEFAIPIFS